MKFKLPFIVWNFRFISGYIEKKYYVTDSKIRTTFFLSNMAIQFGIRITVHLLNV